MPLYSILLCLFYYWCLTTTYLFWYNFSSQEANLKKIPQNIFMTFMIWQTKNSFEVGNLIFIIFEVRIELLLFTSVVCIELVVTWKVDSHSVKMTSIFFCGKTVHKWKKNLCKSAWVQSLISCWTGKNSNLKSCKISLFLKKITKHFAMLVVFCTCNKKEQHYTFVFFLWKK